MKTLRAKQAIKASLFILLTSLSTYAAAYITIHEHDPCKGASYPSTCEAKTYTDKNGVTAKCKYYPNGIHCRKN